ncbi:hypothetical protein SFC07_05565 [Corynebacterium callunae]|uniref:hypothetical protein n=1 Tax=Corynebacterium callunae TaxID=1721 RepID=UPI003982C456
MSAIAVIHHFRYSDGETLIFAAVDGQVLFDRWSSHPTDASMRSDIVDAFLDIWNAHGANGLIIYVSDRTISRLLKEQSEAFPGLQVRDVIIGKRFQETWTVCRNSHSQQHEAQRPQPAVVEKRWQRCWWLLPMPQRGKTRKPWAFQR